MHEFYDIIIIDAVLRPVLYVNFFCGGSLQHRWFPPDRQKQEVNAWAKRTRDTRG